MRKVYFMGDGALETKRKVLAKETGEHTLYGGIELESRGMAKIINSNLKSVLKIPKGSVVVVNRPNYTLLFKLKGIKVILITWNSDKVLKMRSGLKNKLVVLYERIVTRLSDVVICSSMIQVKRLKEIGVKHIEILHLGVDDELIKKVKKSHKYYLTSGSDKGRNHDFVINSLKGFNLKVLDGKPPLPYNKYLEVLGGAKCLVLNIDTKRKGSSGMSGGLTCMEGLLMKKPIFINYQPWLKETLKENYYIYKNKEDLIKLLAKDIKFKDRDYDYLTLNYFTKEMVKIIQKIS